MFQYLRTLMAKKKTASKKKVAKKITKKKSAVKFGTKKRVTKKAGGVRKKLPRKTSAKHAVKRTLQVKKIELVHASSDASFWVNNGPELRNLLDLYDALETLRDEQFFYHVRSETDNDFAIWVEDVLCDGECAVSLQTARDRTEARNVIKRRLRVYYI